MTAVPFPSNAFDVVTSFDVLYSLEEPVEHAAVAEMYRLTGPGGYALVNVAAMDILRGDHSVLSREVRRYSRAGLARLLDRRRLHGRPAHLHQRRRCFCRWWPSARFSAGAASPRKRTPQQDITVPPAPVNALLTAALRVESWWLRVVRQPVRQLAALPG